MGEAEEVERRVPMMSMPAQWPEVHVSGLGRMQDQSVALKPFAQYGAHTLAALAVFEGQHKIVAEPHQLARSPQPWLRLSLEP